jgi:hypothetical protein
LTKNGFVTSFVIRPTLIVATLFDAVPAEARTAVTTTTTRADTRLSERRLRHPDGPPDG